MGLFEKIKDFVTAEDEEPEDEWDDDDDEPEQRYAPPRRNTAYGVSPGTEPLPRREPIRAPLSQERGRENVIPLRGQEAIRRITAEFKIVVIDPKAFDDCPQLVDSLKSRKPVIINLEHLENDTARKIFDFLSGATYALSGNVQKIAQNIFVFLPENVDVQSSANTQSFNYGEEKENLWN